MSLSVPGQAEVKPHLLGTKLPKGGRREGRRQACYLQLLTYNAAKALARDLDASSDREERARLASSITNLVKAWDMTRERIRILDGDPMPGSLRPVAKVKKTKQTSTVPLEVLPVELRIEDRA